MKNNHTFINSSWKNNLYHEIPYVCVCSFETTCSHNANLISTDVRDVKGKTYAKIFCVKNLSQEMSKQGLINPKKTGLFWRYWGRGRHDAPPPQYFGLDMTLHFVHKTRKFSIFGLTWGHRRSCDSVMVGPIFVNLMLKDAQDLKEKSQHGVKHGSLNFMAKIVQGGHHGTPSLFRIKPPPPAM